MGPASRRPAREALQNTRSTLAAPNTWTCSRECKLVAPAPTPIPQPPGANDCQNHGFCFAYPDGSFVNTPPPQMSWSGSIVTMVFDFDPNKQPPLLWWWDLSAGDWVRVRGSSTILNSYVVDDPANTITVILDGTSTPPADAFIED